MSARRAPLAPDRPGGPPQFSPTAILLTFTLAAALLYGSAFAAVLPYRLADRVAA